MPTYEYRCRKCSNLFEQFQKITAKPVAKCPRCGGRAERLLSAGAGLVFKGSGFYVTDYKRSAEREKTKRESAEAGPKPPEKPAEKPSEKPGATPTEKDH